MPANSVGICICCSIIILIILASDQLYLLNLDRGYSRRIRSILAAWLLAQPMLDCHQIVLLDLNLLVGWHWRFVYQVHALDSDMAWPLIEALVLFVYFLLVWELGPIKYFGIYFLHAFP